MLHNILIVTNSGVLLFKKEFFNPLAKADAVAGILTGLETTSIERVGLPLAYIELSTFGICVVSHPDASVRCILFIDREDGHDLGRLVANEILNAFVEAYPHLWNKMYSFRVVNPKDFAKFSARMPEILRTCVRPVIDLLQSRRGIEMALLLSGDEIAYSGSEVDRFALVANLQALLNVAADILVDDILQTLVIECGTESAIIIQRVDHGYTLVVLCQQNIQRKFILTQIQNAVTLMRKVLDLVVSVTALPA